MRRERNIVNYISVFLFPVCATSQIDKNENIPVPTLWEICKSSKFGFFCQVTQIAIFLRRHHFRQLKSVVVYILREQYARVNVWSADIERGLQIV